MKILMLAPQPFLEPRGTPLSVYQRIQGLLMLGHEIDLVTYHLGSQITLPGLQIHRIPNIPFVKELKVGPSWPKPWLDLLMIFVALRLLISRRYEAIHSHEEAAFFAVFLSYFFRVRHVYDMHSSLPGQLKNYNFGNWWPLVFIFKQLEKLVINTCDVVITVGPDLAKRVKEINPRVHQVTIENMPIHMNNNEVSDQRVAQLRKELGLHDALPVVYTGTFEAYQGLDLLISSALIVTQKNPKARFIIVGGKEKQVKQWQNITQQMGIQERVKFVGTVSPEESLLFLQMAEVLVSPRTSGLSVPLKIYSYLESGKAVVATKIESQLHVLNQEIAYLVEPTEEALAAGILKLLEDSNLRASLGENARSFIAEKHSLSSYLEKLGHTYRFAIDLPNTGKIPAVAE